MIAYCIEVGCGYKTDYCETVGEVMNTVRLDGGKLEGIYSECPKCNSKYTIMVNIINNK